MWTYEMLGLLGLKTKRKIAVLLKGNKYFLGHWELVWFPSVKVKPRNTQLTEEAEKWSAGSQIQNDTMYFFTCVIKRAP